MSETPVSPKDAGVVMSGICSATHSFPASARVRAKAEFTRVFESGKRRADPMLALHWLPDAAPARLGLAVSRKVDPHAVGRNRIKRVLRDAFRRIRPHLPGGAYVVVARGAAGRADNPALRRTFVGLLERIDALPRSAPVGTMRPACAAALPPPSKPDATTG